MQDIQGLKARAQATVDGRRDWLISVADTILRNPEPGFQETKTSRLVSQKLGELGVAHGNGLAITGIKGYLRGGRPGPTVALIAEMDSLRVPGHPHADPESGAAHACGHHCQPAMMLGAAAALMEPEVLASLSGNVALMAVPAEELIDVEYRWGLRRQGKLGLMGGKQELIRLGAFDDVDMAMMVHTSASPADGKFSVGGSSNGHLVKYVSFIGRAAHAGGSPHRGVNALQAAMIALNAINTQRETLRDQDAVRFHGIMTYGGAAANSTPADVRYEGRVRGRTAEAIADANMKMDRCLRAGALAMGARVNIVTIPGYLPIINNEMLVQVFRENATPLVGEAGCVTQLNGQSRGGSTDMGDLSHIMPAIHPYTGGFSGSGHGVDYLVSDYEQAVINPAKALATSVIDLLSAGAVRAREVVARSPARMSKKEYVRLQEGRLTEDLYTPR